MSKFIDGTGLTDILTKIKNAFVAKSDTTAVTGVSVDSTPTANSTNLVESGGVKAYVDNAVAPEIFWATYGTTTLQEIKDAYNGGKLVVCNYQNKHCVLSTLADGWCYLTCEHGNIYYRLALIGSSWSNAQGTMEMQSNKVTSISASSTDSQYPSAKCVYDELQGKQGVIDSTHKLDYSLIDNQPTIPTVPTISTSIASDSTSNTKTASPKAVADYAVQCLIPGLKLWAGTEAEYNLLTPSNDTVYVIKPTT